MVYYNRLRGKNEMNKNAKAIGRKRESRTVTSFEMEMIESVRYRYFIMFAIMLCAAFYYLYKKDNIAFTVAAIFALFFSYLLTYKVSVSGSMILCTRMEMIKRTFQVEDIDHLHIAGERTMRRKDGKYVTIPEITAYGKDGKVLFKAGSRFHGVMTETGQLLEYARQHMISVTRYDGKKQK